MMASTIIIAIIIRVSKNTTIFNMLLFLIANILFVLSTSLTLIGGIILSIVWLSISNFNYIQNYLEKNTFFLSLIVITITSGLYNLSNGCQDRVVQIMNIIVKEDLINEYIKQEVETKEEKTKQSAIRKKVTNVTNVTSAVFLYHLNVAIFSIVNKPLGYGLNNYEVAFRHFKEINKTDKTEDSLVYKVGKYFKFNATFYKEFENLNYNDGSSNLFKIIAEFGYLSFIILFLIVYYSFTKKIQFEEKIFLIPIIVTQLCRGAGYFNGGFMFCFVYICYSIYKSSSLIKSTQGAGT